MGGRGRRLRIEAGRLQNVAPRGHMRMSDKIHYVYFSVHATLSPRPVPPRFPVNRQRQECGMFSNREA